MKVFAAQGVVAGLLADLRAKARQSRRMNEGVCYGTGSCCWPVCGFKRQTPCYGGPCILMRLLLLISMDRGSGGRRLHEHAY